MLLNTKRRISHLPSPVELIIRKYIHENSMQFWVIWFCYAVAGLAMVSIWHGWCSESICMRLLCSCGIQKRRRGAKHLPKRWQWLTNLSTLADSSHYHSGSHSNQLKWHFFIFVWLILILYTIFFYIQLLSIERNMVVTTILIVDYISDFDWKRTTYILCEEV